MGHDARLCVHRGLNIIAALRRAEHRPMHRSALKLVHVLPLSDFDAPFGACSPHSLALSFTLRVRGLVLPRATA